LPCCIIERNHMISSRSLLFFLSTVVCALWSVSCFSQNSVYRIGLILPFQTESTTNKLEAYSNAHDFFTASRISLSEDVEISLDFYEGVLQSLNEMDSSYKVELSVYDNWNNDSITEEILQKPELKRQDIIIGSVSTSTAKLVSDFCLRNKIINIQPFSPSKSLGADNPYHLKLAPTIEAHADAMFNSIVDSFAGSNVIIYTPSAEKSTSVAEHFDSLFRDYNKTADRKFTTALLNTKDMMVNGIKTTAREQLKEGRANILILTSFDESFVNGNLRVLTEERDKYRIVVFGMPTWMKGEVLRLDYINAFSTRISDPFYVDSSKAETQSLIQNFKVAFGAEPSRYSYLGYDVMNFTRESLRFYGKDFLDYISTQRYIGTGYRFDIVKGIKHSTAINYLENRNVYVFKVQDYQLKKVW
jgi:ABC-type branched-subunit amino acid transport system substrate-binding protein